MACKTESKYIGGVEYSVTQWSAEKALLMKFRLGKIIGPAVAGLAGIVGKDGKANEAEEAKAISESFRMLFETSSPEELVKLIKDCVVGVGRDGTRITESSFQEHFSGDSLMEVYKVFVFVLKVNYGNFFKGQLAERVMAKVKESL